MCCLLKFLHIDDSTVRITLHSYNTEVSLYLLPVLVYSVNSLAVGGGSPVCHCHWTLFLKATLDRNKQTAGVKCVEKCQSVSGEEDLYSSHSGEL